MQNPFQQYADAVIAPETQVRLNQPLATDSLNPEEEAFLKDLTEKLEKGGLDPMNTRTLFNRAVYDKLSESEQEATDMTAINVMGILRQIQRLWAENHHQTFQIQNLVHTVFRMKSRFEEKHGDVFII